ncbi:alginate export family protein [Pedobacter sp. P351]|uniref:alginate export family protein n=1 Tax=Pedobacter superstes TaxID=3133441 RepID=UPI00309809E7
MYRNLITKKSTRAFLLTSALIYGGVMQSFAQISLTGQLRPRAEVRDGVGNLVPKGSVPASFISQRTRLAFGYKWDRLTFGATVQDIRVWGQDASTISNADGNRLMLHEGWGEVVLANKADTTIGFKLLDNLSFKIGRQELVYDDARLIGNLDWLQQGRRFDMALLKTVHHGWQVDLGFAYNQNSDNFGLTGTTYIPGNIPQFIKNDVGELVPTPAGMVPLIAANGNSSAAGNPTFSNPPSTNAANQDYKNFQSLYISKKINQTKISILGFKDAFARYTVGSVAAGEGLVYGRMFNLKETNDRYTVGAMISPTFGNASGFGKIAVQGAYYQQLGEDRDGKALNAYHYTVAATYSKGKFTVGPGIDLLSGNKTTTPTSESKRFDPLYGTPHKFWGYMDYFYAGTNSPAAGLLNYYMKSKFTANEFFITADYHHFAVANKMAATPQKDLGDEIDLVANYTLNKFTSVELGYSMMFAARDAMKAAKGQTATNLDKQAKWGFISLNIRPDFFFTKPVAIKQ